MPRNGSKLSCKLSLENISPRTDCVFYVGLVSHRSTCIFCFWSKQLHSPHLCVGFLFLILYPVPPPPPPRRLRLPQLCHTPSHTIFHSHTTLSHTHTPSFTHSFVTRHLSHTTLSHTLFHTQLCHTPSFTHNCDLHALPCKSRYNCVDHHGNQQDGCSHYAANCNSRSPNPLAQRSQSSHWLTWKCNLQWQERNERKTVTAGPVAQTRFPSSTPGATFCEKTQGSVKFPRSKHHLDAAIQLWSASTALQITLQLRRPPRQSTRSMQPSHCKLQPKITKPIGTAQPIISLTDLKVHLTMAGVKRTQNRHSRTCRTDGVPPVDAGSRFVQENGGCRKNFLTGGRVRGLRTSPRRVIMSCCGDCCDDVLLWWCIVVMMYCCGDVLLWWCIVVVMYCCDHVLLWWCIVVILYCCGDVLLWWCIVVMMYCCDDIVCCDDVLLWWCIVVTMYCCHISTVRIRQFRLNSLWQ